MLRLVACFALLSVADGACLANATPAAALKKLVNRNGESYPLGVWINNWAAGEATSYVVGILIEEMLGFEVNYTGLGDGSLDALYAVTGCKTPMDSNNRGCTGVSHTLSHLNTEAWLVSYADVWENIATETETKATSPVDVGSMGYEGRVSFYFGQAQLDQAYEAEGLALDYYANWDARWRKTWKYFTSLSEVDRSHVKKCQDVRFTEETAMKLYVEVTGDTAGVFDNGGTTQGYCEDGYFWLAPRCRGNTSQCIPFFTGGAGWNLEESMMKATRWNMPLAVAVAEDWSTAPGKYASPFIWWVPDPTHLALAPQEVVFPSYSKAAWADGDKTTGSQKAIISKIVSKDLALLAPAVQNFMENFKLEMKMLNSLMMDQKNTGDTWQVAACRWLNGNQNIWMGWLPDDTTCFPTFGLFDIPSNEFVADRSIAEGKTCRACPSGTYSKQLVDAKGVTYICEACPAGTSQSSGASLQCDACGFGEFQNELGQQSCKRCPVGRYQDAKGGPECKLCPDNAKTLGLGQVSILACGCKTGYIDTSELQGNLTCQKCLDGLNCPEFGTVASLTAGQHSLAGADVPDVQEGYFVTIDQPLQVYKCGKIQHCPGGLPGQCNGGLVGTPCAECPADMTESGGKCIQCEAWKRVAWVGSICFCFFVLTCAYYLLTSKVTAKASVLFTTSCAFGMLISLLQSIGIIGMMTVEWPVDVKGFMSFFQILLLDLDSFGFACVAGANTPLRYSVSVVAFPLGIGWLLLNWAVSQLIPRKAWDKTKTASAIGQFLQVTFSTMSTIALAPLMCYTHPNKAQSLLKYPSVICWSGAEHSAMLVAGLLLLSIGVFGFVALCTYAAVKVPQWSATEKHHLVRSFRFLVFRFRLDSWWFGVPLLVRGPMLSLPIVLATDYSHIQTIWVTAILAIFLTVQTLAWPWKVPLLNSLDCWISYCILILVAGSALYLNPVYDGVTTNFVDGFSMTMMVLIFGSIGVMVLMSVSALIHRVAMGGHKEYVFLNLGRVPDPKLVSQKLKEMGELLADMTEEEMEIALDGLAVFDTRRVMRFMTMMYAEVLPNTSGVKFGLRVSSSSFAGTEDHRV